MEVIAESSSFDCIEINSESNSPDSLPDLLTDMECIELNSSSASDASPSPAKTGQTTARRSRRASTSTATKNLDEKLHSIKRRTISKPRRLDPSTLSANASEKLIEKLYTNKKLTKVKPTNLETIFEEPKTNARNQEITYISTIKYHRAINFKDHSTVNKQKVQTRRKRIKRLFGRATKLKKISMDAFKEHLEALAKENDTVE